MEIVFDIETTAFDFASLSESQQEFILRYAEKEPTELLKSEKSEEAIRLLNLYPFTAKVITIGMLEADSEKAFVLFDGDSKEDWFSDEKHVKYKAMQEIEMLKLFWEYVEKSDRLISFNGRQFDIPFLMMRSAINKIRPSKNLIKNRFDNRTHLDLLEEFTFHGLIKKFNLDFYCHSFGIESPKGKGVTGMDVNQLYKAGRIKELATYCSDDILATFQLYKYWKQYLNI
ncbi:MAG: ribonuclease H-like domain-containing protein [Melioribacteraceae bacterium]|nr:ribonuclease H-like domain-containing protein [Melioribacteraceae bacterium]MCF8265268.1 ribonuclease H-like domain-containing protein [Melioribacteraceae bacterium]MCF8413271.1 ribonuclease H-like domain-containing protein [Melioribacteraceae bacterium]MCF8431730.1 ribonuclease H-like domain-containing protein [Melioribacteraceae bacterium]